MKIMMKRTFAFLMVLVMCLSVLSAVEIPTKASTVDYVYAGNYIKNWGTRGTTATFLSPNAEEFYEDNNTSYAELALLSGASSTSSVPSSALYRELQELMESSHSYKTGYDATRDLYQYTDCQNSGKTSSKISSFYSGTAIGPSWDGGSTWNREHTWPNSKGLGGQDENDIMMLRPTSKSENSSRGNTAYGEGSNYYDPNKYGMSLRGDVARIMLYQYVRWGNTSYMWGTSGVMESKAVLLKWMEEDPVDTWELGRNDSVESITGTRNVFVDYPELAFILFDAQIPTDMTTPSGEAANDSSYTITAQSSNSAHGTVSVSGRTINAVPAAGYEVSGFTLVSGTAQITRSGNAFTVEASSDCTVRINFVPRSQKTVSFYENGSAVDSQLIYSGDVITLPQSTVQTDYTFMGWVDSPVEQTATIPAFYTAGSKFTVTEDVTLYALYAKNESGGTGNGNVFELYSGELTEGDYIVTYNDYAMKAEETSKPRLDFSEVTYTNGDIVSPDASIVWHIAPSDGYWTIYNAGTSSYAGGTGAASCAGLLSSNTDYAKWTATGTSAYNFVNKGNADKGVNATLRKNGTYGFACYHANFEEPLTLYKQASGTVYYFTGSAEEVCSHPNAYEVETKAPTCTESGYTAGVYCPDCDEYLSGHEVEPATGHSYDGDTCSVCGAGKGMPGDLDGNGEVDEDDAIYLLQHVLMPEAFEVNQDVDYDGNDQVDEDDAIYLLQHVLMPGSFPLEKA